MWVVMAQKKTKISVISAQGARESKAVAVLRLLNALCSGAVLVMVAAILGKYAEGSMPQACQWIAPVLFALLAACIAYAEISVGGRSARAEEQRIRRELLTRLFNSLRDEDGDPGKVVQLLTDNTERVTEFRQIFLGSTMAAMAIPFVTLTFVGLAFDPILGFGIMAMCPLIPILLGVFMRFFRRISANSRKERGKLAGQYLDAIRNLVTIRLLGAGQRTEDRLREQGEKNRGAIMKLLAGNQVVIIVVDGLFSLILVCATAALTISRFNAEAITLGQALATMLLTVLLIEPLVQVAGFFYIGMGGMASQKAIRNYYRNHDGDVRTPAECSNTKESEAPASSIRVADVSYDYGRGDVLRNVSFEVPAGHRVAIVGRSGAGKSTLLGLLRGALPVQGGTVEISGNNLAHMEQASVRALTASVTQATWLFTGTIADNLQLAKSDATEAEMWQALKRAQVADEVERMPLGLHTDVGEQGGLISGGQAQRISIARALLSGRKVLLLDEPTSQVDIESEHRIIEAIRGLGREWTLLIVTHRKALLEIADDVYEMADGRLTHVAERGTESEEAKR